MAMVIYKKPGEERKHSWIKHLIYRISQNQNNLVSVVGKTGSGKTYSALVVCELMSKENGVPFSIDHVVFNLLDLMRLINSGTLKKGSCIVFDEPQISISSRDFQSEANRVFNYLLTTFRHKNLTLFFCTPYADLLDKTCRKLFHAEWNTLSINRNTKTVKLRPTQIEWNPSKKDFIPRFLKISWKDLGDTVSSVESLRTWEVPKPSKELIDLYEIKKNEFTSKLNKEIEQRLEAYERKQQEKIAPTKTEDTRKPLTDRQAEILDLMREYDNNVDQVAHRLSVSVRAVYKSLEYAKKKGHSSNN